MCNVSRELLVHYDRIGLLKPKEVTDKGYRYYSLKQLYLFDVIRFFVDAGMSSCEIEEYLENRSTDLFLDTIETGLDKLRAQHDLLDARDFSYTKIVTWVSKPERAVCARLGDRLMCKPRGTYAVILHQGGTSSAWKSYERLLAFVCDEGLRADGPIYELDVNSYLMSDSADDYLLHISMRVGS